MLTRELVWCVPGKKKQLIVSIAYAAELAFNRTQYRAVLNYYRDPLWRMQEEGERVGGLLARADRSGGALKGQGTASEGYKSW